MDKITYLTQLAEGLARWVPERERQEILRYYAEYFEEAGPQRESDVIAELGDPWALSSRLAVEGGYATQAQVNSWTPSPKKRKIWPIVLGAAGVVLIVGIATATAFFRLVRSVIWDTGTAYIDQVMEGEAEYYVGVEKVPPFASVETAEPFTDTELEPESFRSIDVDIGLGDVNIIAGNGFYLELVDDNSLGCYLGYEVRDGVLRVFNTDENIHEFQNKPRYSAMMTLVVPYGYELGDVTVNTGLGDICLENLLVDSLTANTKIGEIECDYPSAQTVTLNSDLGDVELSGCPAPVMELSTKMGEIDVELEGCAMEECAWDLSSAMGGVSVNDRDYGASAYVRGDGRPYQLKASSGMGEVSLEFD